MKKKESGRKLTRKIKESGEENYNGQSRYENGEQVQKN